MASQSSHMAAVHAAHHHHDAPADPEAPPDLPEMPELGAVGRKPSQRAIETEEYAAQTESTRQAKAMREISEMALYALFLTLFTVATIRGANRQELWLFSDHVEGQFTEVEFLPEHVPNMGKTFTDVATVGELYQWMLGPMHSLLYTASSFDMDDSYPAQADVPANSSSSLNRRGLLGGQGRVVGAVRISQLRTEDYNCEVPDSFNLPEDESWACPTPWSIDEEESDPYGYPNAVFVAGERDADQPNWFSNNLRRQYPPPRFTIDLPNPAASDTAADEAKDTIEFLWENKFIDRRTRAVFVDVNVHNPSLDYTLVCRLAFEMTTGGGVFPTTDFKLMRLYRYHTTADFANLALELVVFAIVVYYSVVEVRVIRRKGLRQWTTKGALVHSANLLCFYLVFIFRLRSLAALPGQVDVLSDTFYDFRTSTTFAQYALDCNSFNAVLCWGKVMRYLAFVKSFKVMLQTLDEAAGAVAGFGLLSAVILFGFSQAFLMAFGSRLYGFRNLTQSFFSLLRLLLGDGDFEALRMVNPVLGPLLYMLFVLVAVFVLLNMFIAIISDAYADTKDEIEREANRHVASLGADIAAICRRFWDRVRGRAAGGAPVAPSHGRGVASEDVVVLKPDGANAVNADDGTAVEEISVTKSGRILPPLSADSPRPDIAPLVAEQTRMLRELMGQVEELKGELRALKSGQEK